MPQSMPTYAMSVYLIPKGLCADLERHMNRFWWGSGSTNGTRIHWMSWGRLCQPRIGGGLGFKRFHEFNIALLGKQGWQFITRPSTLVTKIFKARYFPRTSFLEATLGNNPSYCWRIILSSQALLRQGCARRIGNGMHPWLAESVNPMLTSEAFPTLNEASVSSLMVNEGVAEWDIDILRDLFNPRDVDCILKTPIRPTHEDTWY